MNTKLKITSIGFFSTLLLFGCSNSSQDTQVSKPELTNYLFKEMDMTAVLFDKYSDSIQADQNLMKPQASKIIKFNDKMIKHVKDNSINKNQSQKLVAMAQASNKFAKDIESDHFNNFVNEESSWINKEFKARESLKISKKSHRYDKFDNSVKNLDATMKEAREKQPHIDKKNMEILTSTEKIDFTKTKIVNDDEGNKNILIYYTATNLSDEPQAPYELFLDAAKLVQDNGDSYSHLDLGSPGTDYENSQEYKTLSEDSSLTQIKPQKSMQAVECYKLSNVDKPLLFQASDRQSNTDLGTLKVPLDFNLNNN
ncbi:DUF5067 domain-containing protein [Bombilactobacillus thymidiniphilus]|uniref:DUF5067 domain-containing protein n=1 Tax=Bombilactobacillus thymidiniphilus TaxID=2923363 RepID=A0ABY4PCU0_9LACO|nr:DUF5067 domain-containing protein [Bombilactobacillus thymidiniphilus]UQS83516.1 DUF5067 domain-containing protein [Bombilactobacillus thymidiniphilus]